MLALVFSRFLIIALLLIWQVSLIVGFYGWLNDYFTYFSVFVGLFSLTFVSLDDLQKLFDFSVIEGLDVVLAVCLVRLDRPRLDAV